MTTSNVLIGVDNKLDNALTHYGVKGMKWGKKKAKEEEPTPAGGGGKVNTEEEDARELEAITKELESGGDMKFKEFTTLLRRRAEIQKRMDARNNPDAEQSSSQKKLSTEERIERGRKRRLEREEKRSKPDDEQRSSREERITLDKVPSEGVPINKVFNLKSDLSTEERIERGRKRRLEREEKRKSARHSDLLSAKMKDISPDYLAHYQTAVDLDNYLMHYGVKGMRWGVRKDKKTGRVKSVAKRTPLVGKNETGKVRDVADNLPGGKANHKAIRRTYLDARVPIKQGLRNINNDERFKGKDLTNEKSKLTKQYHKEISGMVTEKLAMSAIVKSRKNDKYIPKLDYDMSKSSEPQLTELRSKNQYNQPGIKQVAKQYRDRDMNATDKALRVAKRGAVTLAAYTAASNAIGAGIVGAMLVESLYGESTPSMIRGLNDSSSDLIRKEMEKSLRQSDEDQVTVLIDPIMDDLGHILDVTFDVVSDTVTHDEMVFDDYLMHYGIKGMRWGVRRDLNKSVGSRTKKKSSSSESPDNQGSGESSKSGSNSGSTKTSKNLTTDQKLDRLDKLSEEKNEILNYTDEVKKAAREVTSSSGETLDGPLKTILEFHPKGVDIADDTADKMGFYDPNSDSDINKLLKDYRKRDEKQRHRRAVVDVSNDVLANMTIAEMVRDLLHAEVETDLDDYLMHYGVKGMRWGVRKDGKPQGHQGGSSKSKSKSASDKLKERASKVSNSAKKKIRKATDPKERAKRIIRKQKRKADIAEAKAEADARIAAAEKKAAAARKDTETTRTATTAKSGSGSMSDKELKAVVERMNLEKQYAKHMSDAKPKKMSDQLLKFAKDTAIDYGKQRLKAEINRNLGNNFDKLFKVAGATTSTPDPTPEPKNPFTFKARKPKAPKAPKPKDQPRSEPRTQSPPTRPTPPSYGPTRPALMSPPSPSILALPAPKPKGPSSGGSASTRMKDNPTVAKFGKVSMDQVQAYKEGRPYKPFDPRRRR